MNNRKIVLCSLQSFQRFPAAKKPCRLNSRNRFCFRSVSFGLVVLQLLGIVRLPSCVLIFYSLANFYHHQTLHLFIFSFVCSLRTHYIDSFNVFFPLLFCFVFIHPIVSHSNNTIFSFSISLSLFCLVLLPVQSIFAGRC